MSVPHCWHCTTVLPQDMYFCNKIYLDVCLNSDYGPAQRFYIKRGYIPDGKGVYYEEKTCETDAVCRNNDELTLCLVKEL